MLYTTDLDDHSQFSEEEFKLAWSLFEEEEFKQADALALRLTMEPAISNLHKAGCHMILAHSPDRYVYA